MTEQEIFDRVTTHLLTQKVRSGESGDCRYRTKDGLQCAAGCLISEENYSPCLEGFSLVNMPVREALVASGIPSSCLGLVSVLQNIHDATDPANWEHKLKSLASQRGFTFNPPA